MTRLSLYNQGLFCGAQAIQWELSEQGHSSPPSIRTINRIISRNDLTHRRTGRYEAKGVPYPVFTPDRPNQRHQMDFVGPRHLKGNQGTIRFYSLNVVDLATKRCGVQPLYSRSGNALYEAIWAIWRRSGMPQHLQVDNELAFLGSYKYPRGMGPLVRLCLCHDIELWFIPLYLCRHGRQASEPWRNAEVEGFNNHYQQKFLARRVMGSEAELEKGSLEYEHKHNSRYRYSKLGGKTPLATLKQTNGTILRFPPDEPVPKIPLGKPESGRYHFIRHIRGDGKLDVLGEKFRMPPELHYEYVVATVDVDRQKLKVIHDLKQVLEFNYEMR